MVAIQKALKVLNEDGAKGLLGRGAAHIYQKIRPLIPGGYPARLGGIVTCYDHKWIDRLVPSTWLPWRLVYELESYEAALLSGLNQHVREGDRIVIVGAGIGVTAVCAALRTGGSGRVECFEGSLEQCKQVKKTAKRNNISNLNLNHAVVASVIDVHGDLSGVGIIIPAARLPPCDVLELDCEGSEVQILREMIITPRVLLVETHGINNAPTSLVKSLMEDRGYLVSDLGWAEPALKDARERDDVRVLLGVRNGDH